MRLRTPSGWALILFAFVACSLFVGCGGTQLITQSAGGTAKLTEITIAPANKTIAKGTDLQLAATGIFSDGKQQDLSALVNWQSNPSNVATVNAQGRVSGLDKGVALVSAAYQGLSGSVSVTVGAAVLTGITVTPQASSLPLGEIEPMTATGRFSDGTTQDLTQIVAWSSSAPAIATVSPAGAVATGVGKAIVSAAYQGLNASASVTVGSAVLTGIAVSPQASSLPLGETQPMIATGRFSDGTTQDLTQVVAWSSSAPAIATVSAAGAVAVGFGTTMLSASAQSITGTANLTVTAAVIMALNVVPGGETLLLGKSGRLQAMAVSSDGTTQDVTDTATWSSEHPDIVDVSSAGMVTAERVGSATIDVESNGLTGSALITVTPLMTVSYFNLANAVSSGVDGTVRLVNPGTTPGEMCAMLYVFDRNQELNECCGCKISDSGLLTLSLIQDLTANTLTGQKPVAGSVEIVPSDPDPNGQCNAASPTPDGMIHAWETNSQGSPGSFSTTEILFAGSRLSDSETQVLATLCSMIQRLGSGSGICSCGTGD